LQLQSSCFTGCRAHSVKPSATGANYSGYPPQIKRQAASRHRWLPADV